GLVFPPLKAVFAVRQNRDRPPPGQALRRLSPEGSRTGRICPSWRTHKPHRPCTYACPRPPAGAAPSLPRARAAQAPGLADWTGRASGARWSRRCTPPPRTPRSSAEIPCGLLRCEHAGVKRAICRGMNGSETRPLDLFVVGGGINGAGIACDAAGRALKVGLCEMNDFASATSSKATKLIHGGLRYLEHYEFRLVREALMEREVLLAKAP